MCSSSSTSATSARPLGRHGRARDGQPGERGDAACLAGVGDLGEQAERVLGLTAPDEDLGQADDGLGTVGLELERPAKRGLITEGDQLLGLARNREEPVHELADGGLAERADELVDDPAFA